MTPAQLRERAERELEAAEAAAKRGDKKAFRDAVEMAFFFREAATALTAGKRKGNVNPAVMTDAHRQAISEAHSPASGPMAAARAKGLRTLRDVAAAMDCTKGFLSQVFNGKKPMPDDKAVAFEKLTGYPAKLWKA